MIGGYRFGIGRTSFSMLNREKFGFEASGWNHSILSTFRSPSGAISQNKGAIYKTIFGIALQSH